MRPNDHIGWVYSGDDEFVALATTFLAEGASLGERLMYVAADPDVRGPLAEFVESLEPGSVQVASVAEVYGTSGIVEPISQRATFASALEDALAEGYTGVRVAADNTALVQDPEHLAAWVRWEIVADHFMSEHAVTGLCAFNQQRVDVDVLRHLATLHPLSSASNPIPQFRLFVDGDCLWVEGDVDASAIEQARVALETVPRLTELVVDFTLTTKVPKSLLPGLLHLSRTGTRVTVRGDTVAARALGADINAAPGLVWVNA